MAPLLGVFGGTFDPPHLGHHILASEARSQLGLERLVWVLTPSPPHKQDRPITCLEHRLAMLRLALAGHSGFELSTVEADRPAPHYTVDTVKILADGNPGWDLVYLMGGDALHDLPSWRRPADLVAALRFIGVMRRPGDDLDLPALERALPGLTAKVRFVDTPAVAIAAREIRARAAQGRPFRRFLSPAVHAYIQEHGLYR